MNPNHRTNTLLTNQRGVIAIIVALAGTVLLGMAALAVDIGYLNVAKNELQNIVDASALAGAGELSRQYLDEDFVAVDEGAIVTIAGNVANSNESGFSIQVQIGTWRTRVEGFIGTLGNRPNAVRAIARRGSDGNSQIPTFFARIWSIVGLDAQADAVAALTGSKQVGPGELEIPVGISQQWFTGDFCDQNIQFYPTSGTTGCAGWHVYEEWPANASKLRDDILGGMLDPPVTEPFTPPGLDLNTDPPPAFAFTGGNLSTTLDNMTALYLQQCVVDLIKWPSGECVWSTEVVVYDEPCGENPNQTVTIIGFASVEITAVIGPPPVLIATVECEKLIPGGGGGTYYGTWGSIPGLVE
jgi:hypothetical protein